jgi:tripartite-type tricarboxylate transporter receptor subunit TctC
MNRRRIWPGTPEKIVNRLADELISAVKEPATQEKLTQQGYVVRTLRPAELAALVRSEVERWAKVVKESGLKSE